MVRGVIGLGLQMNIRNSVMDIKRYGIEHASEECINKAIDMHDREKESGLCVVCEAEQDVGLVWDRVAFDGSALPRWNEPAFCPDCETGSVYTITTFLKTFMSL